MIIRLSLISVLALSLSACATTTNLRDSAREIRNHNRDYQNSYSVPPLEIPGDHREGNTLYHIPNLPADHCRPIEDCPNTIEPPDF